MRREPDRATAEKKRNSLHYLHYLHYLEIYASLVCASADPALPDSGYSVG
jgi:hypothetical protein